MPPPRRPSLETALSGHQERLRRLEVRTGGSGFQQVEFVDGALLPWWAGTFRSSAFRGTLSTAPRVYLDLDLTLTGTNLTVGTLDASAWPPQARLVLCSDLGGNVVELGVSPLGVVTASAYHGYAIAGLGATYIL